LREDKVDWRVKLIDTGAESLTGSLQRQAGYGHRRPASLPVWRIGVEPTWRTDNGYRDVCDGVSMVHDHRRSRNPRPSKIAGTAFSIRAVRVPDCFAPAK
jgi:hypothetical protein